jgi:hypothetical protein
MTVAALNGTTAGFTFQWRKGGVDLPGATMSTLPLGAVTAADAGTYGVRVQNGAGESVASTELIVRPLAAPVITVAPRNTPEGSA